MEGACKECGLTLRSSGRLPANFACFQSPLISPKALLRGGRVACNLYDSTRLRLAALAAAAWIVSVAIAKNPLGFFAI